MVPDSKVHGANMRPTWVLSSPGEPHVGPMNLVIRGGPLSDYCFTWRVVCSLVQWRGIFHWFLVAIHDFIHYQSFTNYFPLKHLYTKYIVLTYAIDVVKRILSKIHLNMSSAKYGQFATLIKCSKIASFVVITEVNFNSVIKLCVVKVVLIL